MFSTYAARFGVLDYNKWIRVASSQRLAVTEFAVITNLFTVGDIFVRIHKNSIRGIVFGHQTIY